MRAKVVMFAVTAVAVLALVLGASSQANAQGNANKSGAAKKPKPAATKPVPPPPPAAQAPAAAQQPAAKKPVHRAKKKSTVMKGVPSGVANCLKRLSELASKDPLIGYEGQPEEIVNNGLLWNDPKSKCSVGSDENTRKKVAELATAWRMKDAAKVRSLIQEVEGMAH